MSLPFGSVGLAPEDPWARLAALGPTRRVLVSYESSACGRAALFRGLGVAGRAGVSLTVVSVATKEPVAGCGLCRQNAVFWNREKRLLAEEDLAEARSLVGPSPDVDYAVAVGRPAQAIGQVADQTGADVIVLPWESSGRLRRLFSSPVVEDLRKAGRWGVIVAPAAPPESPDDAYVGTAAAGVGSEQG